MQRFKSKVNKNSADYVNNHKAMTGVCEELDQRMAAWQTEGPPGRLAKHRSQGKLLARERLALILDQDSPFLEIGALTGYTQEEYAAGNATITGIGLISGIECMIVCNVPTVGKGAMNRMTGLKWNRASEISMKQNLPFVLLLESGGADLTQAFDVFHINPNPFYQMAKRSAKKVPNITIVFGTCIAGGAYMGGMSDYCIMVKGQAHLALAGSKLVFMATGEQSTEEELGGAEMHCKVSGVGDYLVNTEQEACEKCREIVATFEYTKKQAFTPLIDIEEPFYDPDELLGVVNVDFKKGYDCREVIARIVDASKFHEFKPLYGSTAVCVWGQVFGIPVGIVSNNGVIFHESAQKATHFINICNQRGIALIFLHNVTGFMVGKQYEEKGMIKWGSQMVNAISNANVPQISIIMGGSFGAANYAMCGIGFKPDFLFSWPVAQCAVMGPDQLSGVLDLLARGSSSNNKTNEAAFQAATDELKKRTIKEMDAYYITGHSVKFPLLNCFFGLASLYCLLMLIVVYILLLIVVVLVV